MNPEDAVIDLIDALVDEQLTHTPDDYEDPFAIACELCYDEWHGLPDEYGCPGAYATAKQRIEFDHATAVHPPVGGPPRVCVYDQAGRVLWSGVAHNVELSRGEGYVTLPAFLTTDGLVSFVHRCQCGCLLSDSLSTCPECEDHP